jgi:hypothetical protein
MAGVRIELVNINVSIRKFLEHFGILVAQVAINK